jgi:K+-sensing histidine kinase KdpD
LVPTAPAWCAPSPRSGRGAAELVDRLHFINTRAIDLTETLLALAEGRGLTVEISGGITPTVGSHALLQQMVTNLVHNAIVHNSPSRALRVTTSVQPQGVVLTVETPARSSPHTWCRHLSSRFVAAPNASAPTTLESASG